MKRLSQTAFASVLATALLLAVSASPAAAVVQFAACAGEYEATYDPGVNYDLQEIDTFTKSTYECTLSDLTTATATVEVTATITTSCLDPLEPPSTGQGTLTWDTGETTVYDWTAFASQVDDPTLVTVIGKVVAGKYVGAKVVRSGRFVPLNSESQCSSPEGLTHAEGDATLLIMKLL